MTSLGRTILPAAVVVSLFLSTYCVVRFQRPIFTGVLVVALVGITLGALVGWTRPPRAGVLAALGLCAVLLFWFGLALSACGLDTGWVIVVPVCVAWGAASVATSWAHAVKVVVWSSVDVGGRRRIGVEGGATVLLSELLLDRLGVIGFLDLVRTFDARSASDAPPVAHALPLGGTPSRAAHDFVVEVVKREGSAASIWDLLLEGDPDAARLRSRVSDHPPLAGVTATGLAARPTAR